MFTPERVIFERQALDYPLGELLYRRFCRQGLEVGLTGSHNRVRGIPGKTWPERFYRAKRTLVVGVRRGREFATCRPSAHFQLPLATGCPGLCEYCYLLTNLGRSPYVRIYVNLEEILEAAASHINSRLPEATVFEGAATSDPLAVEPYSGALARTIEFFAGQPRGRFRFVTKFDDVDSLLPLRHGGATRFRFSINTRQVIHRFEHGTPPLAARLVAARKVAEAGYPLGFMIAPIIASGSPGAEQDASGSSGEVRDASVIPYEERDASGSPGGYWNASVIPYEERDASGSPGGYWNASVIPYEERDASGRAPAAYEAADWESEYGALLRELAAFSDLPGLTFELITHRFTARAKTAIRELFPRSLLPLEESERRFQWGQFGYGKYVFRPELRQRTESFFRSALTDKFPLARLEYFV